MKTVLLIYGNPMMCRSAYAQGESFVSYGIVKYYFQAVDKFDCPNALLFWDSGKSRWRSDYYPDYKIQREDRKSEFDLQSQKYDTENWIIMLSWLLKHPAQILPIIGTTTPSRIQAAKQAIDIDYSREDWYRLLEARNGYPIP